MDGEDKKGEVERNKTKVKWHIGIKLSKRNPVLCMLTLNSFLKDTNILTELDRQLFLCIILKDILCSNKLPIHFYQHPHIGWSVISLSILLH